MTYRAADCGYPNGRRLERASRIGHAATSTTITPAPMAMVRRSGAKSMPLVPLPVFQYTQSAARLFANPSLPLDKMMTPLRVTGSIRTAWLIAG